jgi:alkylation response protein AidB-like acyl-CoA dehydrogenase
MSTVYTPPIDQVRFLLEVFGYPELVATLPGYEDFDLDTAMSMLDEYARFCVTELLPLNGKGDRTGLRFNPDDGSVTTPPGFRAAYQGFASAGFAGLSLSAEYGGSGAPHVLSAIASEVLIGTNKSFSMCPGLTTGLVEALEAHGTDELKAVYLPKLISGEWTGTMCLTEPQCGTDLGLLTTKAVPEGDHYRLTGTKIWITFGEHDLTENIVHLVLARLPDAPPGIKGISVFVVPKVLPDGTRNGVRCGGLEHKMGIHASPTCVINLEDAVGYLVGEPHKGMRSMFTMMNNARLHVGVEGVALGEAAYQNALAFAKDRRQSRSLNPARQEEGQAADNILVHPDVRRMLLNAKSTTMALRGLVAWIGVQIDISHKHPDADTRDRAENLVALLTPIIKSYATERGFANVSECMQVMGGAGYTQDWPVEQHLRDVRIGAIYEGTNHIQALDLVGRKLPRGGGQLLRVFMEEITGLIRTAGKDERMAEFIQPLKAESKRLQQVTMEMAGRAMQDQEEAGAAASSYLNLFALTTLAYVWARMCAQVIDQEPSPLRREVLSTARFYYQMVLPEAEVFARRVGVGKSVVMDFDVADL